MWEMSPCAIWCETVESNHAEREAITLPHSPRTAVPNGAVPKSRIESARETFVICTYEQHRAGTFGGCIASVGPFGSADTTTISLIPFKCR